MHVIQRAIKTSLILCYTFCMVTQFILVFISFQILYLIFVKKHSENFVDISTNFWMRRFLFHFVHLPFPIAIWFELVAIDVDHQDHLNEVVDFSYQNLWSETWKSFVIYKMICMRLKQVDMLSKHCLHENVEKLFFGSALLRRLKKHVKHK